MKNIILFSLFSVTLSFFSSCSEDSEPEVATRGKATFKVGSVEKVFTKLNSFNHGILALGDSNTEAVSLWFPIPSTFPTTYKTNTTALVSATYSIDDKDYIATSGIVGTGKAGSFTIKITKYSDAKISGTFEFTALSDDLKEEVVITQGVFNDIPDL